MISYHSIIVWCFDIITCDITVLCKTCDFIKISYHHMYWGGPTLSKPVELFCFRVGELVVGSQSQADPGSEQETAKCNSFSNAQCPLDSTRRHCPISSELTSSETTNLSNVATGPVTTTCQHLPSSAARVEQRGFIQILHLLTLALLCSSLVEEGPSWRASLCTSFHNTPG